MLVLGATGFVGKTVCELLTSKGLEFHRTSLTTGVDLRDADQTNKLFEETNPDYVLNCASYVGGIQFGYEHPAEIFRNNLLMTVNIIEACHRQNVRRIINPVSNCVYPGQATLFREDEIWDGPLHESVMVYGMARKMSWIGAWAYHQQYGTDTINLVPPNIYGPGDHFDPVRSHALGALIKKMVDAKKNADPSVPVWGTGKPVREWMYIEDGAEALIRALDIEPYLGPINIGVGEGVSIADLARMIKDEVGYQGEIRFDMSKPDGATHKTLDGARGEKLLGWKPQITLPDGIRKTVQWYYENVG
ncbi:MAG: NAD-dependent epimerase/dehydratase family protein [Planctomycetes bacterium]|nr:NAD-dependent epimerase/dehydratase family protein [Planctomycetota bacterium]